MSWLRPATPHEQMCDQFVASGNYVISYLLRVATPASLSEELLGRALTALYRRVPTLRLHLQDRDGQMWLKYVDHEDINFQVIENADVHEEWHNILKFPFPGRGPLWAARLLPWSDAQQDFAARTSMELPDDGKPLPCAAHVLLVFHHAITDGHSCLRIVRTLLSLLDQAISGAALAEAEAEVEQVACVLDPSHEEAVKAELEAKFKTVEGLLQKRLEAYPKLLVEPMLYRKLSVNVNVEPKTVAMPMIVHKELNQKFLKLCKENGITYHTGFTAVLDAAYVKFLKDLGIHEENYPISSMHCANLRTYYGNCENAFGNGMGVLDTLFVTPGNVLENFWPYAKNVCKVFKKQYDIRTPLMHEVVEKLSDKPTYELLDWDEVKKNDLKKGYIYGTTNMLDVSRVLANCGENVRLEFYDRISTVYCYPFLWCSVFQTFHGNLMHSLQYNANLMGQNSARQLSDNISYVMKKVCA